jgi:hypothetical protein
MMTTLTDRPAPVAASQEARYTAFARCVDRIKYMAGQAAPHTKSIRDAIRDGSFSDTMDEGLDCELMEVWHLQDQIDFLTRIQNLDASGQNIQIYETAYALYRAVYLAGSD